MVTNNVLHRDDSSSPIAGCEVRVLGETPDIRSTAELHNVHVLEGIVNHGEILKPSQPRRQ